MILRDPVQIMQKYTNWTLLNKTLVCCSPYHNFDVEKFTLFNSYHKKAKDPPFFQRNLQHLSMSKYAAVCLALKEVLLTIWCLKNQEHDSYTPSYNRQLLTTLNHLIKFTQIWRSSKCVFILTTTQ